MHVRIHIRIIVDDILQHKKQMNDILCNDVGRSRLCTEDKVQRTDRLFAVLDLQILMDDVQCVHLLALVLMKALDLNVENTIRIQLHALMFADVLRKSQLVVLLDLADAVKNCAVILILQQILQPVRILLIRIGDGLRKIVGELMVAGKQPSAEGDAVCLVIELLRIDLVELVELRILKDLRMNGCNAVYREAVVNVDIGHMNAAICINNLHIRILVFRTDAAIQLLDDRNQLRNHLFQIFHRPGFQSLCKDGVVRVCAGLRYHLNRLIHGECLVLGQNPDQLRDHQRRVCVIDLDHGMIIEVTQIILLRLHLAKNPLSCIADHEILLVDAKKTSLLIGIVRIQEQRQILLDLILIKGNSLLNQGIIHGVHIEQTKLVDAGIVADDINVVHV